MSEATVADLKIEEVSKDTAYFHSELMVSSRGSAVTAQT